MPNVVGTMGHARLVAVLASLLVLPGACSEEDKTPPAAPIVDPIASPTGESTVAVTGTAEFGAMVRVAGGASAVDVLADPYTARWFADVELAADDEKELGVLKGALIQAYQGVVEKEGTGHDPQFEAGIACVFQGLGCGLFDVGKRRQQGVVVLVMDVGGPQNHKEVVDETPAQVLLLVPGGLSRVLGCGLAGGEWKIVKAILETVSEETGIDITIYEFEPPKYT